MTDIEIYEIGCRVLVNKLGPAGLMGFTNICRELNGGPPRGVIKNVEEAKEYIKLIFLKIVRNSPTINTKSV